MNNDNAFFSSASCWWCCLLTVNLTHANWLDVDVILTLLSTGTSASWTTVSKNLKQNLLRRQQYFSNVFRWNENVNNAHIALIIISIKIPDAELFKNDPNPMSEILVNDVTMTRIVNLVTTFSNRLSWQSINHHPIKYHVSIIMIDRGARETYLPFFAYARKFWLILTQYPRFSIVLAMCL